MNVTVPQELCLLYGTKADQSLFVQDTHCPSSISTYYMLISSVQLCMVVPTLQKVVHHHQSESFKACQDLMYRFGRVSQLLLGVSLEQNTVV